ncbi:protein C18orf25 homolog isoform X1 [Dicentrarchus labrax]|uniref:Arkadia (RNF111) N-terminal like PKA signaling regulator 2N n=1 Tax=Dicentrarchus labrax TaxID=13489 RepID=A0A8P4GP73_DICLA|nr:protein C18orf25 homolog isoform X1 [Dicentrarchus labrax]XP_051267631.1 protein C18orf25 homolog isoform X1 [Dicentrarchus labrax]XP_051267632.1 protein C18orf25 homolog isoform X1 [Dicentrarchus labrax]
MKMADSEKAEEFVDAECPLECLDEAQSATTSVQGEQDEHLKTETTTSTSSPPREKEADSPLNTEGEQSLLSMPCLMKELRRDSPESQHASTGSDKPVSRHIYESDSSNPCMLSPSSSGHLADSDTLSSGEDGAAPRVGEEEEGSMEATNDPGQATGRQTSATAAGGRKSRRSRSESEMPPNAMAAKKNRCQATMVAAGGQEKQTNGKMAKVKGHRSQKHKERMRLLRQKREAAARKKYNLLQDSSTSDSELTCDSSTSSSEDDDDDTSGGSKTIKTDISDGPPVVGHYDISDTDSNQESMSVETVRPTVIKHELKTHRGQDMAAHSGCIRALSSISGQVEAELSHKGSSQHNKGQINIASSDSEVEIVGVQEKARCAHPCGGVIKSLSSWKENSVEQLNSTNQPQLWTTVSPQPNWVSPPEVVDLTLDEDAGHKYLL